MYALVYWCDSKDSSVIPVTAIETTSNTPPEVGNIYQMKWLKKTYTGRILRISDRPTDFDHVTVTEEGIVVDAVMGHPVNVPLPPQQICAPMARKRRKDDPHHQHPHHPHHPHPHHPHPHHPHPHGHVDMSTNLDNNFILDDPMLSLPALIQDRIQLPDTMCCRKACVDMLDRVISYAADLRRQLVEDNEEVLDVINEVSSYPSGSGVIERKVELTPGSGVFINRREKLSIAKGYRDKPNEMVRQLVRAILGDSIKDMSARGTSGSKGIPREVIQAVQVFVADHSKEISNKAMTKILNNMISGLRHPHKKRREMEGNERKMQTATTTTTSSSTTQQAEPHVPQPTNTTTETYKQENDGEGVHFMTCN